MRFDFCYYALLLLFILKNKGSLTATTEQSHFHLVKIYEKPVNSRAFVVLQLFRLSKTDSKRCKWNVESFFFVYMKAKVNKQQNIIYVIYDCIKSHAKCKATFDGNFFRVCFAKGRWNTYKMGARFFIRKKALFTISSTTNSHGQSEMRSEMVSSQVERVREREG